MPQIRISPVHAAIRFRRLALLSCGLEQSVEFTQKRPGAMQVKGDYKGYLTPRQNARIRSGNHVTISGKTRARSIRTLDSFGKEFNGEVRKVQLWAWQASPCRIRAGSPTPPASPFLAWSGCPTLPTPDPDRAQPVEQALKSPDCTEFPPGRDGPCREWQSRRRRRHGCHAVS